MELRKTKAAHFLLTASGWEIIAGQKQESGTELSRFLKKWFPVLQGLARD